jgi:two-component system, NarL family, response regulator
MSLSLSSSPSPPRCVRVLIADDHAVVRAGIAAVVGNLAGFELVGSVETGLAALTAIETVKPDIVMLDLHLPDISGLEVLRRLRGSSNEFAVLVITSTDSDHTVRQAIALGARGYFVKSAGADALVQALQSVSQGRRYLSPQASEQLVEHLESESLTAREIEVLRLASLGLTNGQIGKELEVSERTIKFHINAVFHKLKVSDRTAAVVIALKRGILDL